VTAIVHTPWPKIARLNRTISITEKIDGTNAAVGIVPVDELAREPFGSIIAITTSGYAIYAQSRNRLITPESDNAGFAQWVKDHAENLAISLGRGLHFGEWWGRGIQRGYGLSDRHFSLFNTDKADALDAAGDLGYGVEGLDTVPLLYRGTYNAWAIEQALDDLHTFGSVAAAWSKPEGIVIYHHQARIGFEVLLENDALPKSAVEPAELHVLNRAEPVRVLVTT